MLNIKLSLKIACGLSNDLSVRSSLATKDMFKQLSLPRPQTIVLSTIYLKHDVTEV